MNLKRQNLLLLFSGLVLVLVPLFTVKPEKEGDELFLGADDKAGGVIKELSPGYKPWFVPLWEPPSSEIQSLLFSLQAALGTGAVAYCLGYYRGKRRALHDDDPARY